MNLEEKEKEILEAILKQKLEPFVAAIKTSGITKEELEPNYFKKFPEDKKHLNLIRNLIAKSFYQEIKPPKIEDTELESKSPTDFFNQGKFIPKLLGDEILSRHHVKTLEGSDDIFIYNKGVYINKGKERIKSFSAKVLKEKYKTYYTNETISFIQATTYTDPNRINHDWVNLKNGLLNPLTGEFKEHTPEVFSVARIPIEYNKNADCPLFKKTLGEKINEPTMKVAQEMFGYTFLPGQKYEIAFLLYGPKRTMKSTTLSVLEHLLGRENIVSFPLQQLTTDPFAPAYLYGKSANICADLTSAALRDTGMFMRITGGDAITGGKKGQHHITFYPSSKLIFSCNVVPPTRNKILAFYRRWIILHFNKQTPEEEIDPDMKKKLLEELPGILNWALEGLQRLLLNNKFSYWLSPEEVKDLWERYSDTIQSFIFNEIDTEDDEGVIIKRVAYKKYKQFCERNNLPVENQIKFGRMFIALTGCGTCRRDVIPAYKGVSFKDKKITDTKIGDFK